jgi:hypothetical protein
MPYRSPVSYIDPQLLRYEEDAETALDSVIWKTNLETCGLLSLSPDDAYLAYECDNSGLFVTDVRRLTHGVASHN